MKRNIVYILSVLIVGGLVALGVYFSPFVTKDDDLSSHDLKIGETKNISGVAITLQKISEDSRCPIGVTCIWAGRVIAKVHVSIDSNAVDKDIELGSSIEVYGFSISLDDVTPTPKQGQDIQQSDYRALFSVKKNQSLTKKYQSQTLGFSFEYPKNYYLDEKTESQPGLTHLSLFLSEDTLENKAVREGRAPGREGPTGVSVDIYQDELTSPTLIEWLKDSPASNFTLSKGTFENVTLSGKPAVKYRWDGLYTGDTIAAAHRDYIIAVSVTSLTPTDPTLALFDTVIKSLKLK